jgi:hypothetical protein
MTAKSAEIVFEIDPHRERSEPAGPPSVCRRCFSTVRHNLRLRLSFCPVHGLGFELAPSPLPPRWTLVYPDSSVRRLREG